MMARSMDIDRECDRRVPLSRRSRPRTFDATTTVACATTPHDTRDIRSDFRSDTRNDFRSDTGPS